MLTSASTAHLSFVSSLSLFGFLGARVLVAILVTFITPEVLSFYFGVPAGILEIAHTDRMAMASNLGVKSLEGLSTSESCEFPALNKSNREI